MAGENRHGAINLLGRHDACHLVRPRHRSKSEDEIRRGAEIGIEAIRTADDETQHGNALIAAYSEIGSKLCAREISAGLIEGDAPARTTENRADCFRFVAHALLRAACLSFVDLTMLDDKSETAAGRCRPIEIALRQIPLGSYFGSSHRDEQKTHVDSTGPALAGPILAPHFFKIVELTHFGPEEMDDNVASIHQNPIAMRQSFDPRRLQPGGFERLDHMFGDRPNVNVGTSGRYDHGIGEGSFAMQVEADDVFGFGIFETRHDRLREKTGVGFIRTLHRRKR
jgi:hypothetical protein